MFSKIVVAGSLGGALAGPSFSQWAPILTPRRGGVGGILFDKYGAPEVYVTGGSNSNSQVSKNMEVYNAGYDEWRQEVDLPTARSDHAAAPLGDALYVGGGATSCEGDSTCNTASVQVFTPESGTWTEISSLNQARRGLSFATDDDSGLLYAIGGMSCPSNCIGEAVEYLATFEVYDVEKDLWTELPSMPTPRRDLGVAVIDSIVYAVGGCGGDGSKLDIENCEALTVTEKYDPATRAWSSLADMATPRRGFALGMYGTQLIVAGGSDAAGGGTPTQSSDFSKAVLSYDSINDNWYTVTTMPDPRDSLVKGYNMFVGISMFLISGSSAESVYVPTTELMALMCSPAPPGSASRGVNVSMPFC